MNEPSRSHRALKYVSFNVYGAMLLHKLTITTRVGNKLAAAYFSLSFVFSSTFRILPSVRWPASLRILSFSTSLGFTGGLSWIYISIESYTKLSCLCKKQVFVPSERLTVVRTCVNLAFCSFQRRIASFTSKRQAKLPAAYCSNKGFWLALKIDRLKNLFKLNHGSL